MLAFNFLPTIISLLVLGVGFTYLGVHISTAQLSRLTLQRVIFNLVLASFFVGVLLWASFYKNLDFQYLIQKPLFIYQSSLQFGIDGLSLLFVLLTLFIFPLCFLAAWSYDQTTTKTLLLWRRLLIIEILLILSFSTTDLLYFYVFFESLLIPMYLYIGINGSRARKMKAAYYFFLYTLFGSLFMMVGIFYTYFLLGSTNFFVLLNASLPLEQQAVIWLCFFLAFAVKMPLFPFHLWLPEAHVEAPTIGSVILASLLLKLGGYGFLRFSLTFLRDASFYFAPVVICLATAGVLYGSLSTIRQVDLKRIIAYSSVAHMNLVALGLFSFNHQGLDGAIYLMVAHGFVSGALFFCIGVLYERYHTRLVRYYGGRATIMPFFASFFLLFTLANMSLPGTSNFLGEFLIFAGLFSTNFVALAGALTGVVCSAIYSLWLYNRVMFGTTKVFNADHTSLRLFAWNSFGGAPRLDPSLFLGIILYGRQQDVRNLMALEFESIFFSVFLQNRVMVDLTLKEAAILFSLAIPTIWFGLNSMMICEVSYLPVSLILEHF